MLDLLCVGKYSSWRERRAEYCYLRTIFSLHGYSVILRVTSCVTSIGGSLWGLEVSLVVECLSGKHRTPGLIPITENIRIEEGEGREGEHAGRMA